MNSELRKKAEEIQKREGVKDKSLYAKDLESLVEELSIYQIELEHQNQELQQFQKELLESRNRYAGLFNQAPVGYFIIDKQHKIIEVNATACQLLNMDHGELNGQIFTKNIHPDYQDLFYFHLKQVVKTGKPEATVIKIKRSGKEHFFVRLVSSPDETGGDKDTLIRITATDINNEKELELKLIKEKERAQASEMRWQFAVDGSGLGLWDWDLVTDRVFYSAQWKAMLGYSQQNITEKSEEWTKRIHPEDRAPVMTGLDQHLKSESEIFIREYRMLCNDESYKWILGRGKVISRSGDGQALRMIGTHIDISDRKEAEKAVIQSQRFSAVGELAAGVAHDFNNALQGIIGSVELALLSVRSDQLREYLETINKSAHDAAERVVQLQRFSGQRSEISEYQIIEINTVVKDTILQTRNLWKDSAHKHGYNINIETNFGSGLLVRGNLSELRSVLYNIIKNSVEAMPGGGSLKFSTSKNKDHVYITVSDTGHGMSEESQSRIFQPFYTTKGFDQGKGLGMSGAYSIIQEHGGHIYVSESTVGKGTTIEIELPVLKEKTVDESDHKNEHPGSARVLWVDDEEVIRKCGAAMLESMHHKADCVSSAKEAIEMLNIKNYDLLITDVGMPEMNGWQLLETIRDKNKDMKIAVVTGWGDNYSEEQKAQYGVWRVLSKPVTMKHLKTLIGEMLHLKEQGNN